MGYTRAKKGDSVYVTLFSDAPRGKVIDERDTPSGYKLVVEFLNGKPTLELNQSDVSPTGDF